MNFDKVNKRVKKFQKMCESFAEDDHISSIERDLLLNYVRMIYNEVQDIEVEEVDLPNLAVAEPVKKAAPKKKEVVVEEPVAEVEEIAEVKEEIVEEAPVAEVKPEKPSKTKEAISKAPKVKIPEDLAVLFEKKEVKELSDKLSQLPIKDLSKSISINEKIFTIKELFGNKKDVFDDAIKKLNGFKEYDEAKDFLMQDIAPNYGWTKKSKLKKAEKFIRLVQRRYT